MKLPKDGRKQCNKIVKYAIQYKVNIENEIKAFSYFFYLIN